MSFISSNPVGEIEITFPPVGGYGDTFLMNSDQLRELVTGAYRILRGEERAITISGLYSLTDQTVEARGDEFYVFTARVSPIYCRHVIMRRSALNQLITEAEEILDRLPLPQLEEIEAL